MKAFIAAWSIAQQHGVSIVSRATPLAGLIILNEDWLRLHASGYQFAIMLHARKLLQGKLLICPGSHEEAVAAMQQCQTQCLTFAKGRLQWGKHSKQAHESVMQGQLKISGNDKYLTS